jgi:hypothetical protein
MAGDTVRAEALYRAAHQIAPTDTDALRGLGALALQALRPLDAEAYFTATLDLDPTDPVAIAGLNLIRPDTATETRLRQLIAGQADALAPRLALPNTSPANSVGPKPGAATPWPTPSRRRTRTSPTTWR